MANRLDDLPGYELIAEGLAALEARMESAPAFLVAIGAPRLRRMGLPVPSVSELPAEPELKLYRLLGRQEGLDAYSQYNALIRRLVSFEGALEQRLACSP